MIRITRGYSLACPIDAGMFEDRRRVFIDLLRWEVPVTAGRFEIDQFDGPAATYFADLDDDAKHRGSLHLLPASGPHILGDLFPALSGTPVPRGPDVAEITRLCLPARLGAKVRLGVRNRLISAMVDHALAAGITTLTGVVRPPFRDTVLAMGWRAAPLGPARILGGMTLAAFRIAIDRETPALLAATGIYAGRDGFGATAATLLSAAA